MKRRTFLTAIAAVAAQPPLLVFGRSPVSDADRLLAAKRRIIMEAIEKVCNPPIIIDDCLDQGFIRSVRIYKTALPNDILQDMTR